MDMVFVSILLVGFHKFFFALGKVILKALWFSLVFTFNLFTDNEKEIKKTDKGQVEGELLNNLARLGVLNKSNAEEMVLQNRLNQKRVEHNRKTKAFLKDCEPYEGYKFH